MMTKVNGLETRALVDTGASHNFIEVDEAKPIFGVARGVKICFGEWCGLVDL